METKKKRDELKKVLDDARKQNAPLKKKKDEAAKIVQRHHEENQKLVLKPLKYTIFSVAPTNMQVEERWFRILLRCRSRKADRLNRLSRTRKRNWMILWIR